jgi:uncharacterized spore protein YtfJ
MDKETSGPFFVPIKGHEEAMALLAKLADVAQPSAVYSEPVVVDDQVVITASEVSIGLGFGYGMGGGNEPGAMQPEAEEGPETEGEASEGPASGFGTGGGGGGGSSARPVAVIHISPEGVRVEPVVDVTKVVLAFFTMMGGMFIMFGRMRRHGSKM